MPRLHTAKVEKIFLPSFENNEAVLEVETPVTIQDFEDMDQSLPQTTQTASVMAKKIKKWNLVAEDDTELPITAEIIVQLDAVDFAYISMALGLDKMSKLTPLKKNT
jgi:hypothetical protein